MRASAVPARGRTPLTVPFRRHAPAPTATAAGAARPRLGGGAAAAMDISRSRRHPALAGAGERALDARLFARHAQLTAHAGRTGADRCGARHQPSTLDRGVTHNLRRAGALSASVIACAGAIPAAAHSVRMLAAGAVLPGRPRAHVDVTGGEARAPAGAFCCWAGLAGRWWFCRQPAPPVGAAGFRPLLAGCGGVHRSRRAMRWRKPRSRCAWVPASGRACGAA